LKDKASPWPYRVLALVIAVAIWYVAAAEKREPQSQKSLEASVTYNVPPGLVLMNPTSQVRVLVAGSTRELRRLRPYEVDVLVELPDAEPPTTVSVDLTADDVSLPAASLKAVSIDPKLLSLQLDRKVELRLPVEVDLVGEPAAGVVVVRKEALPNMVEVEGPAMVLSPLRRLLTNKVSLDGHAFTFDKEVPVIVPSPLIQVVRPPTVTVRITLEPPPAARIGGGS
jgi:YbbR domain-containing protein